MRGAKNNDLTTLFALMMVLVRVLVLVLVLVCLCRGGGVCVLWWW
jgi:hypothetical protein